jgi:hypothetical protein
MNGDRRTPEPEREDFATALLALGTALGFSIDVPVIRVYWYALKELPSELRIHTLMIAGKRKWFKFPQPSELNTIAAELMAQRRKVAFAHALPKGASCPTCHGSRWREIEIDGVARNERCPCWQAALQAADRVGQMIALPLSDDQA